jgi:hypothetical protein
VICEDRRKCLGLSRRTRHPRHCRGRDTRLTNQYATEVYASNAPESSSGSKVSGTKEFKGTQRVQCPELLSTTGVDHRGIDWLGASMSVCITCLGGRNAGGHGIRVEPTHASKFREDSAGERRGMLAQLLPQFGNGESSNPSRHPRRRRRPQAAGWTHQLGPSLWTSKSAPNANAVQVS